MRSNFSKAVMVACIVICFRASIAEADDYLLAPQDHIRVKLYDWRPNSGDTHEWTALNGEFTINSSGRVSIPIIGDIAASDRTSLQLAEQIGRILQLKVGLMQAPVASVEISEYSPFYILGAVDKPGEYEAKPGLTLAKALALAGGEQKVSDLNRLGLQRDFLTNQGDLAAMEVEKTRLEVKLVRLQAQGEVTKSLPSVAFRSTPPKLTEEEQQLFDQTRDSRDARIKSLRATKAMLEAELVTLAAKDSTLLRQIQLGLQELANATSLLERGLGLAAHQTALQANQAQLESSRLDIQLATSRARQEIQHVDADIRDNTDKAQSSALTEAEETRSKIDILTAKIATARALMIQAAAADTSVEPQSEAVRFLVSRASSGGKTQAVLMDAGDDVKSGDTIRVERVRLDSQRRVSSN